MRNHLAENLQFSLLRQVLAAVFGGPRLLLEEIELPVVRDTRTTGGRSAKIVQGVGHDEPDLRGRSRAVRTRPRSQYFGVVQGAWYLRGPKGLAYSLQVGRVSVIKGVAFVRATRSSFTLEFTFLLQTNRW